MNHIPRPGSLLQRISLGLTLLTAATAVPFSLDAAPKELIKNGSFSPGLSQWRVISSTGGVGSNFFAHPINTLTPLSGNPTGAAPGGGATFAVSDQGTGSFQVLAQKFRVPRDTRRVILSYRMFIRSTSAVAIAPNPFDLTPGSNQQGRVELLKGEAGPLATGSSVVKALYQKGADAVLPPAALPFKRYRFNLTRLVEPGKSYRLRFLAVATTSPLNLGVDSVSVKSY